MICAAFSVVCLLLVFSFCRSAYALFAPTLASFTMEPDRSDHEPPARQRELPSERAKGKRRQQDSIEAQPSNSVLYDQTSTTRHSPPTASSSFIKPSRKRRKQFKYMLSHARTHTALSQHHSAQHHQNAHDQQHNTRKESRKKVKKACIFCKRSHMPCEEARPCQRCVKRGISDLCRDAEPATASSKSSSGTSRSSSSLGGRRQIDYLMDAESFIDAPDEAAYQQTSEQNRAFQPTMPISHLLSPAESSFAKPIQRQHQSRSRQAPSVPTFRSTHIQSSLSSLPIQQASAWIRSTGLPDPQLWMQMHYSGHPLSDLQDDLGDKPISLLIATSIHAQSADDLLRDAQQPYLQFPGRPVKEEHDRSPEPPLRQHGYSYGYGYAKLALWAQTRYSRSSRDTIDRVLGFHRSRLLSVSRSLPDQELVELEQSFVRLVHQYQTSVLECVPVPMLLTRRTGEIYAANDHMSNLLQLPKNLLEGGQISFFHTVTETDAVELWKVCEHRRGCL